ncbi:MAG: Ada metal-binding domain-containing protein [Candidatus Omnitrophica bacterium]|nr:Ada metal-binding domain-containing protein [Candidatus Omnitrophota bacterium]
MYKKILSGILSLVCLICFSSAAISQEQIQEAQQGKYVGTKFSMTYHFKYCPWVKKAKAKDKIMFKSVKEARKAGYQACQLCSPPIKD